MLHIHDMNVLDTCEPKTRTYKDRRSVLKYMMFLKEKIYGEIMDHVNCDRQKQ